jgi:DNA-binding response OmpR family regulator
VTINGRFWVTTEDCVIVDCGDNGVSVMTEIARARSGVPILFVSDHSEVQLQVYSERACS